MNKLERILAEDEAYRRGLLLTTNEKKLAKARAEALRAQAEADAAKQEAALARYEARELREHIIASATQAPKISFRTIAAAFTVILLSAAVSKIAYFGFTRPPLLTSTTRIPAQAKAQEPATAPPPRHILTHKPLSPGDLQFKNAMLRLQDDLGSLPEGESAIVQEVNQRYPHDARPCPLEWVNGEAALSLDGKEQRIAPSLTSAVTECATAVEKFRDSREASLKNTDLYAK